MAPSARRRSRLSLLIGGTLLAGSGIGCDDAPCEDTLTCDVGDSTSTSSGSGGAASSSSSQATTSTGGGGDPGNDTTPPTVLSVTPSVDATGVSDTATILISFSEPMNRVATQNAFQSTTLTGLSFTWPDDQTMEVTPSNLTYAQGGHDVVANEYSYTITTLAADLAGNQLEDNGTWSFSTLRSVTDSLAGSEFTVTNDGTGPCFAFPGYRVGNAGAPLKTCRALITFDLTPIPQAAQLSSASLTCSYLFEVGPTPTSSVVERVRFDPNDLGSGWGTTTLESYADPFKFAQPPVQNPTTMDVAAAIAAELAGPSPATLQFRVKLTVTPLIQENYLVWRDTFNGGCKSGLMVSYLAP